MPLANKKVAVVPTAGAPKPLEVEPPDYKGVVYSEKNAPIFSLISYAQGAPWSVDYYKQVIGDSNNLVEIDPGQSGIYQQYERIKGLELRVNSPLGTAYDAANALTSSTGNAFVYGFLIPNRGDHFIASTGDGGAAIFAIINVERKTFNRNSGFVIDYELINYVRNTPDLYTSLESKVIRTYWFSKDRLLENLNPFLTSENYETEKNSMVEFYDLAEYYVECFLNRHVNTLIIPGQPSYIYDPFLMEYLRNLLSWTDSRVLDRVRYISTEFDPRYKQDQFWSILMKRSKHSKAFCNQQMVFVPKTQFNANTYLLGVAYYNIHFLIYPKNPDTSLLTPVDAEPKSPVVIDLVNTVTNETGQAISPLVNRFLIDTAYISVYKPVTLDGYYVLSEDFYNNGTDLSVLEIMVNDYINDKPINGKMLMYACQIYRQLGRVEQFYYGPVLMTLLLEFRRSVY